MKFIDDFARDDLAKSSTILQCILSIMDYECHRYDLQPEVIWVQDDGALISLDGMRDDEIMDICIKVNKQFQRKDKKHTCYQQEHRKTFVKCDAVKLDQYVMLT